MLAKFINWIMVDLEFFMFFLAAVIALLHKITFRHVSTAEVIFRWFVLFPLGVTGLYVALRQGIYSGATAAQIGWLGQFFQFKLAVANFGFGLIAVLAFNASFGFRLAAVLANTCWLWGDALIRFTKYYFLVTLVPALFWLDLILPIILLLCLLSIKQQQKKIRSTL